MPATARPELKRRTSRPQQRTARRRWCAIPAAALCLFACSCTGIGIDRRPPGITANAHSAEGASSTEYPIPSTEYPVHSAHHQSPAASHAAPPEIDLSASDEPTDHAPRTTDHHQTTHHSPLTTHFTPHPAITACPSDPRLPLDCPTAAPWCNPQSAIPNPQFPFAPAAPFPPNFTALNPQPSTLNPPLPVIAPHPDDILDELLCDGGDRALPVHYDRYHRLGLDTQDTVAEYIDDTGEWHVRPSNVVCLYAPRFGQVRTLAGASEDVQVLNLAAAADRRAGIALAQPTGTVAFAQPEAIGSIHVRSRPSGLDTEATPLGVHLPLAPLAFNRPQPAFENITFFLTGLISETEEPFLAETVQAALVWTRDEFPAVMASTAAGQELYVSFTGAEIIGLDDHRCPGDLRIVKTADRDTARPGDVVTFTLRYDNLGDRELYHVRIVDNLTPRLAYVADSGTSDRPGNITVEDNGEGSSLLTFELDAPLPGRTGGTITFQARVR